MEVVGDCDMETQFSSNEFPSEDNLQVSLDDRRKGIVKAVYCRPHPSRDTVRAS